MIVLFILKVVALILWADFISGVVHFLIDHYGRFDMPIIGETVVRRNYFHHRNPRGIIKQGYIELTGYSWLLALILFTIGSLVTHSISWEFAFVLILGANGNYVHKWAHQTIEENGVIIAFLQKWYLLPTVRHHVYHHKSPFDNNFCVLTMVLNPILDRYGFWDFITKSLSIIGIEPVKHEGYGEAN